jgi:hypothetical protein
LVIIIKIRVVNICSLSYNIFVERRKMYSNILNKNKDFSFEEYYNDYLKEKERKNNIVFSYKYLDWLESFIKSNGPFSDDLLLYADESEDRSNSLLLSSLQSIISSFTNSEVEYDEFGFQELNNYFYYKGNYYKLNTVYGQGALTYVSIVDKPKTFVNIEEKLEEKKE